DQEARNVRAFKITFSKDTGHHQTRKQSNGYREQHIHNVKPSFFPAFLAALFRCLSAAHTAFCADETGRRPTESIFRCIFFGLSLVQRDILLFLRSEARVKSDDFAERR
ncbi:MAG: hypothetical protein J6A42_02650, partial [Firmicutes bacterium]|nr:hypothetical protein [Bacillota bacterium]